jgi:hypothetical protein
MRELRVNLARFGPWRATAGRPSRAEPGENTEFFEVGPGFSARPNRNVPAAIGAVVRDVRGLGQPAGRCKWLLAKSGTILATSPGFAVDFFASSRAQC